MRARRPRHHVRDARLDLVVATRAAVALDGLLTGHSPDQPLPIRPALRTRPARTTHRRGWGSTGWELASRHHHPAYGHFVISTVIAEFDGMAVEFQFLSKFHGRLDALRDLDRVGCLFTVSPQLD